VERDLINGTLRPHALGARARDAYRPWTGASSSRAHSWAPTPSRRMARRPTRTTDDHGPADGHPLTRLAGAFGRAARTLTGARHQSAPVRGRRDIVVVVGQGSTTRLRVEPWRTGRARVPLFDAAQAAAQDHVRGRSSRSAAAGAVSRRGGDLAARGRSHPLGGEPMWGAGAGAVRRVEDTQEPLRRAASAIGAGERRRRALSPMSATVADIDPPGSSRVNPDPVTRSDIAGSGAESAGQRQTPWRNAADPASMRDQELERRTNPAFPWAGRRASLDLSRWIDRHIADAIRSNGLGTTGPDPRISPALPGSAPYA